MGRLALWFGCFFGMAFLAAVAGKGSGIYDLMMGLAMIWMLITTFAVPIAIARWLIRGVSRQWHSQAPPRT